jgi:hypothetical protein
MRKPIWHLMPTVLIGLAIGGGSAGSQTPSVEQLLDTKTVEGWLVERARNRLHQRIVSSVVRTDGGHSIGLICVDGTFHVVVAPRSVGVGSPANFTFRIDEGPMRAIPVEMSPGSQDYLIARNQAGGLLLEMASGNEIYAELAGPYRTLTFALRIAGFKAALGSAPECQSVSSVIQRLTR